MKIRLVCFIFFNLWYMQCLAQFDSTLANTIQQLINADQAVRKRISAIEITYGNKSPEAKKAYDSMVRVDKKHNPILKNIIKTIGVYPGYSIVGEKESNNFWALVQHQDYDTAFQKQVLHFMAEAIKKNDVSLRDYAYLYDRLKVNTAQKQLYGTQCILNPDETSYIPQPTEDSLNINLRRAQMGLGTIESYLGVMNERFSHTLRK
ncbi:hypothetical protein CAP35_06120 [Chitinophagaceae bacterium IBVUCB1]|nr:hypothetical protein CAP35_06120 [Chitinophagaceae bacterium IBVUCB1]